MIYLSLPTPKAFLSWAVWTCPVTQSLSGEQAALGGGHLWGQEDSRHSVTQVPEMARACLVCVSGAAPLNSPPLPNWGAGNIQVPWAALSLQHASDQQTYFPGTVLSHPLRVLDQGLSSLWLRASLSPLQSPIVLGAAAEVA